MHASSGTFRLHAYTASAFGEVSADLLALVGVQVAAALREAGQALQAVREAQPVVRVTNSPQRCVPQLASGTGCRCLRIAHALLAWREKRRATCTALHHTTPQVPFLCVKYPFARLAGDAAHVLFLVRCARCHLRLAGYVVRCAAEGLLSARCCHSTVSQPCSCMEIPLASQPEPPKMAFNLPHNARHANAKQVMGSFL